MRAGADRCTTGEQTRDRGAAQRLMTEGHRQDAYRHAFTVESDSLIGLDPAKVLPHLRGSGGQIHGLQAPAFGRQAFNETQGCDDEQHGQEAQ